jgi:hypothetical protein
MSPEKLVGRYAPLAVIDCRSPHRRGTRKESRARMPTHRSGTRPGLTRPLSRTSARGVLTGLCATLLSTAMLVICGAGTAFAGEWVQASCINPNQTAAGNAGWSSSASGGGFGSNNNITCGPSSPMEAILSTDAPAAVGSAEVLHYTPPAGSTLTGGQLDVGLYADGYGESASGTADAYTPEYVYDDSNVFYQCAHGLTPCANGTNDFTGILEIPSGRGGNLYLVAACGGTEKQSCNAGGSNGAWSQVLMWWANLRLSNSSSPAASGVAGPLLSPGARGTKELALTATDFAGPGVYNITVQADGQTLYSGTPDSNGGLCVAVGSSRSALMFDASQPCRQSEWVAVPANTTGVRDGQHTLKVTVTDAAGNTSVVYDGTITTDNAPADTSPPMIAASGQLLAGTTVSAQHGEWSSPSGTGTIAYAYQWQDCDGQGNNCEAIPGAEGSSYSPASSDVGHTLRALISAADSDGSSSLQSAASGVVRSAPTLAVAGGGVDAFTASAPGGVPNGTGASEAAQMHLAGHSTLSRSFAHRALTITGQLLGAGGTPIGGASLDVREQMQGSGSTEVIGHAKTAANGAFSVHVATGASRLILIDYRAFSADPAYTAQAGVRETVSAGVEMHVTPHRIAPTGSIVLAGRVSGPIPAQGVVVELLVHYRGRWEPFRDPRASSSGRFAERYQFEGAVGRFPFRAEVLGGQSEFPYATGESAPVDVATD